MGPDPAVGPDPAGAASPADADGPPGVGDRFSVPGALDGERIDRALALLTGLSRAAVNGLLDAGRVTVGRSVVRSHSRRVVAGQRVAVEGPIGGPEHAALTPEPAVDVPIVWSDPDVVVVDKPAGLVVHPGAGNRSGTLVAGLLARYPDLADLVADPEAAGWDRPGIVQRLDKGTSGLMVVARSPRARDSLVAQLSARTVGREYLTLVHGRVDADAGLIDAPLGRSGGDRQRFRVESAGREARTRYEVLRRIDDGPAPVTLLRCRLETGRTHQVRVHLTSIGHPVVGDDRYGPGLRAAWRPLPAGRPFLHAAVLAFDHPASGDRRRFESPLPEDLSEALAAIDHRRE